MVFLWLTSPHLPMLRPTTRACCVQVTFRRATAAPLSSKVLGEPSAKRPRVQLWVSWNPQQAATRWCPSSLAKLVPISPITRVYGTYNNYSIHGVYKPTYNWGAPHCRVKKGESPGWRKRWEKDDWKIGKNMQKWCDMFFLRKQTWGAKSAWEGFMRGKSSGPLHQLSAWALQNLKKGLHKRLKP